MAPAATPPGGFANLTSYDKGINGVMVDIAGLPAGAEQTLSAADFETVGGDTLAVIPRSVTVRRGAGVNGSDRVTLTWPDYNPATMRANVDVVVNGWLRVTVKANERTGLAQPEVFSFGNLAGETGDAPNGPGVTAIDIAAVRRGMRSGAATVLNPLDVNRDGRVNALDIAAARRNLGRRLIDWEPP